MNVFALRTNQRLPRRRVGGGETRSAETPYKDKLFLDKLGKIRTQTHTTIQFAFIFIKQLNNYQLARGNILFVLMCCALCVNAECLGPAHSLLSLLRKFHSITCRVGNGKKLTVQ